jgi:hypothetical protein
MKTFVTWLWDGWRNIYTPEHVYRMRDMLNQYAAPHRFVCVTDQPERFQGIETIPIWKEHTQPIRKKYMPNCYRRLFLFSNKAKSIFGESVVSIDLDAIIVSNISHLFDDQPFRILKGFCNPYNGSLWQVRPGTYTEVWDTFDERVIKRASRQISKDGKRHYGSDQSVMAYRIPSAPTWGPEDGIYQYLHIGRDMPKDAKILFFAGNKKPWDSQFKNLYWGK